MNFEKLQQDWLANRRPLTATRLDRILKRKNIELPDVKPGRAAFIGSFTLESIADTFKLISLLEMGIDTEVFIGEYNQYPQELINPDSALYKFNPEITYLMLDGHSLMGAVYDTGADSADTMQEIVDTTCDLIDNLIDAHAKQNAGLLVIHTIPIPTQDVWGIHANRPGSVTWVIKSINRHLQSQALTCENLMVLDSNQVEARNGANQMRSSKMRHFGKFFYWQEGILSIADEQLRYYRALKGKMRKCIVLDLDNTLWGGIIGEDGMDGIALGSTSPGSAFVEFQRTLLGYFNRGIILAVNSRNNWNDAMEVIESHPDQVLHEKHFGAIRINWQDKATNIREIAQELNIGLDSMVFFDDDEHNRELVKLQLPGVLVPDFPKDPADLAQTLLNISQFDTLSITAEDRKRGQMYAAERGRRKLKTQSGGNLDDFLKSLETKVDIKSATKFSIPRIAQLTQRTNQFNMTTRRYSPGDIEKFSADPNYKVLSMSVTDKIGDSGIVGVAIINISDKSNWIIDTFLMSCRVLGRRVEEGLLWWIIDQAKRENVQSITGEVIFTPKNPPARELYNKMNFKCSEQTESAETWQLAVPEFDSPCPLTFEFSS